MSALLRQIITYSENISDDVLQSLKKHKKEKSKPDLEEVCQLLKSCLQSFERVYLCIDALLRSISDVVNHASNSTLVVPHAVRLEANEEDIRQYVSYRFKMDENRGDMDELFKRRLWRR